MMNNDLDIYVYTKDFEFLGVIDCFSSLRWRRKYYEAGEFEIHIPYNKSISKFLRKDNLLIRSDAIETGIIESFQINDDTKKIEVIIFGRFLSSILDRRIVKKKLYFAGPIGTFEHVILSSMTPFKNLIIDEDSSYISKPYTFQVIYQNVYDYLNKLSRISTVSHRIIADIENKKIIYENYQGLDRTDSQKVNPRFAFNETNSNINNAEYTFDVKTEKNYVLIGGQGQGNQRILAEIKKGNCSDFDLRETFVDAKSENKEDGITDNEYREILKLKGLEYLLNPTENFEVCVKTNDYKKRWDLGDVVNIEKESWGISLKKRIIEIEEVRESNNQSVSVVFGNPYAETFDDE